MSECYKTSDNKYSDCPPRMSDGRHFTDYRPSNHVELLIAADNGMHNSFQQRQYLQQNGNTLMDMNRQVAVANNGCSNCANGPNETFDNNGTMLPHQFVQTCDANNCTVAVNFPGGLGTDRQYYTNGTQGLLPTQGVPSTENNCMGSYGSYAAYGNGDETLMRNCTPLGGTAGMQ